MLSMLSRLKLLWTTLLKKRGALLCLLLCRHQRFLPHLRFHSNRHYLHSHCCRRNLRSHQGHQLLSSLLSLSESTELLLHQPHLGNLYGCRHTCKIWECTPDDSDTSTYSVLGNCLHPQLSRHYCTPVSCEERGNSMQLARE